MGAALQGVLNGLDWLGSQLQNYADELGRAADMLLQHPEKIIGAVSDAIVGVIVWVGEKIIEAIRAGFDFVGVTGLAEDFEKRNFVLSGEGSVENQALDLLFGLWGGNFRGFQKGGTIPGPESRAVPIVAHGGEPIYSSRDAETLNRAMKVASQGGTRNITQNITFVVKAEDPREADRTIQVMTDKLKQIMA
jgi:hypothetical protein